MNIKYVLLLAISTVLTATTIAQSKLVKYYRKLPVDYQMPIEIKEKKGKVTAESNIGPCKVVHDLTNGYLQIIDEGTGGGQYVFELVIFKTAKGKDIVVNNSYTKSADDMQGESTNFFIGSTMVECTGAAWPDLGFAAAYLPAGVTEADIAPYSDTEYSYNILPRKGSVILHYFGFKSLDAAAINGDKKAIALQKKLRENPIKLAWNKTKELFEVQ